MGGVSGGQPGTVPGVLRRASIGMGPPRVDQDSRRFICVYVLGRVVYLLEWTRRRGRGWVSGKL